MPAPGVEEEEGVGANFGSQLELGSVLEDPTLPANIRVEVESPTKETGVGNSAWGGGCCDATYWCMKQLKQAQVVLQREPLKARKAMEISANRRRRPALLDSG